jgi:SAM-dependent methyltransferase
MLEAKTQPESHSRFLSPPKKSRKRGRLGAIQHTLTGARTVARRRGLRYYAYLLHGYGWPALMQPVLFGAPRGVVASVVGALTADRAGGAAVEVVSAPDGVVVRRQYTDRAAFAVDQQAFARLAALALAPPVRAVDAARAVIELGPFTGQRLEAGHQPARLESCLNRIHAAGVTGLGFERDDIWTGADGQPLWTGLGHARLHAVTRGFRFRYFRDRDRERFNQRFGTSILTERSARAALAECGAELKRSTPYGGWYAGIDFGDGLAVGQFLGTDNGTGRWQYLNGRVVDPLVAGKRVLDLGSNNGSMAIMMLRAGAREVVGLELSPHYARAAELVRRVFEWKDMRDYPLTVENRSMLDILTEDWGTFDVVTAYCSLYCVEEEWMAQVVRKAAALAPVMVLQANMPKPGRQPHRPRAGSAFLRTLLETNGFPHVQEYGDYEYARPLLVGRKA